MSRQKRASVFRQNVKWQFTSSIGQGVLGGLVLLMLGRYLSASGFGEYSIIMGYVTVASLLLEPRMQDATARVFWNLNEASSVSSRSNSRDSFLDFFLFEAACKVLVCTGLIAATPVITSYVDLPSEAGTLIVVAAIGNLLTKLGTGLSTGVLRVLGHSDQYAFCVIGELLLRLTFLAGLAANGSLNVSNSIIAVALSGSIANSIQLTLAAKQIPGSMHALRDWSIGAARKRLRPHWRQLISSMGLSATDLMGKDLDVALLAPVVAADQIGVYKMAKNIAQMAWRMIDPFTLALMPEISRRVVTQDFAGARSLIRRSAVGLGTLAVLLSIGVYIGLQIGGSWVLGPAFDEVPRLIIWMLVGVCFGAPLVWGHPLAVALNRADLAFIGNTLSFVLGLLVFITLVSLFGTIGAAISWSATFLPFFLFTSLVSMRLFKRLEESTGHG